MGYIYSVSCDSCDHNSKYKSGPGKCLLSIDNKIQKNIKSQVGTYYCINCDSIQLFFLGKPSKGANLIDYEKEYQKRVTELKKTSLMLLPFWIYRKIRVDSALKRVKNEIISTSFEDNQKFWNSLNVKPRCFNCGFTTDEEKLNHIHKCGGKLTLTPNIHFQGDAMDIIHDLEGKVIERRYRPLREDSDLRPSN